MGLRAIKKGYWDAGNLQIQAYYRRRNLEDEWIWVAGKLLSVMEIPTTGLVMQERRPTDESMAKKLNQLTRIASTVANVIDKSFPWSQLKNDTLLSSSNLSNDSEMLSTIDALADEADTIKSLLHNTGAVNNFAAHLPQQPQSVDDNMQRITPETSTFSSVGGSYKKGGELPSSVLEIVSEGPYVQLNKIPLSSTDVKMIVLLLTGHLTLNELALHMLNAENVSSDLESLLNKYTVELNLNQQLEPRQSNHSRRRRPSHHDGNASMSSAVHTFPLHQSLDPIAAPPVSCINISHTNIGDDGMEQFSEMFSSNTPALKTVDLSFCNIKERGMLALCRSLHNRRRNGLASLQGLILSGNTISFKAGKELGNSLSSMQKEPGSRKRLSYMNGRKEGYAKDDEYASDYEDDDDDDEIFGAGKSKWPYSKKRPKKFKKEKISSKIPKIDDTGIKLLHCSSTSLTGAALHEMMLSLTEKCMLEELDISSNHIGLEGISLFVDFLEGTSTQKKKKGAIVMPKLNRLNLSDNNLCNDGIAKITRAISKRRQIGLVDLHLAFNNIESLGTGTIMNKLLQHNLVSLSLDNNHIGDSGCQLVAASLTSMHYLSRLNLSFNQIGCRGITSLMRALLGCETITFLGLSGNVMKITGAIAMGFALAHHPRLAHLDLDNCCLSQVAQCHISAGMISNRWVPMQIVNGFRIGPPLAAIGALDIIAQHLGNTECLSIRRNIQMKANLQSMQAQRASRSGPGLSRNNTNQNSQSLSDFVSLDSANITPQQSPYLRMLDWLSRIPFDEDELDNLRRYFYDIEDESPDGLRGSDGRLNLKVRGDLLAALGSNLEKEMREIEQNVVFPQGPSLGLAIGRDDYNSDSDGEDLDVAEHRSEWKTCLNADNATLKAPQQHSDPNTSGMVSTNEGIIPAFDNLRSGDENLMESTNSFASAISQSARSNCSMSSQERHSQSLKARISMFPLFLDKLDLLKKNAQDMMDAESGAMQQDIIAQQFAEASLILLRQLRYHCMNKGLDGWRQGKICRKVLIVDDSIVTRKLVARAFEKANFIVDTAQNGEEGVMMMKESIYDIAFMDIDMPVMNGFDATKALRVWENSSRPGARQPICALTAAYVDDFELSELMKFKEAGLDVMESKPCNIPRLFKVVDDVSPMFSDLSISVTGNQE